MSRIQPRRCPYPIALLLVLSLHWLSAAASIAGGYGEGLLFRVERAGEPPSHVLGTIHAEDPRVTRLPPAVERAFDRSRLLVTEVVMDGDNLQRSIGALMYQDGRDLRSVIGESLYADTVRAFSHLGLPEAVIRSCKPWAAVTLLSVPPQESGQFLDLRLFRTALARGKKVVGLETLEEQLAVFETLTEEDQVALLESTLAHRDELPSVHEQLLQIYLRRDLQGLVELNEHLMGSADPALVKRFMDKAIYQRNAVMVERLLPMLVNGGAFVAVGALHLPGPEGVLTLLERNGYRVTRVY